MGLPSLSFFSGAAGELVLKADESGFFFGVKSGLFLGEKRRIRIIKPLPLYPRSGEHVPRSMTFNMGPVRGL